MKKTKKERLLFLYMVPDTGHERTAKAVMAAVSKMDQRLSCVGVATAHQAYPFLGKIFNRMYLEMLKRAPAIWDFLYDNPDVETLTRDARQFLTRLSSSRLEKILTTHHPKAVVCTQAVAATTMASLKRRKSLSLPLIGIITDFGVHAYWAHPEVDLYLVPHEDMKKTLIKKGIRPDRIEVTGIPIHPKFGESGSGIRKKKKVLLIIGGSGGLGSIESTVLSLRDQRPTFQAKVICGRNQTLYRRLRNLTKGLDHFKILGYVRNVSKLMSAADVLITKPGGLTCAEGLAKTLPLVLTDPLPGQEERNARFLTRHKVAYQPRNEKEFLQTIKMLLTSPKKLSAIKNRIKLVAKPHAAWQAARLILDRVHTHS